MDKSHGFGSIEKLSSKSGGKIVKNTRKKPEMKSSQRWRDEIIAQFQQDSINQSSINSDLPEKKYKRHTSKE